MNLTWDEKTPRRSETILVVDDESSTLDITEEMFSMFGYNTKKADCGERALETYGAQKDNIDLVILDLNMPGMDGYECLEELIRINPAVKVIISTGELDTVVEQKISRFNIRALMRKPYQLRDLLKKVRELTGVTPQ